MQKPPRLFLRFFRWFCHPRLKTYIEGDLLELYDERLRASGKRKADVRFVIDVLLLFRPGIIRPAEGYHDLNQYGMFKNYFKVGIRNILKYKVFSFINVFGLAVAMAVCMLVISMLADQARYDAFHDKKDRIYRILSDTEEGKRPYATSPLPLANALKAEYPIVEETTSLTPAIGGDITCQEKVVTVGGYFADPSFFKVFSFELEKGDTRSALTGHNSIVITREIASRLFNNEDPVGKMIDFADRQLAFPISHDGVGAPSVSWGSFTITGVIDEKRYASHLKFDVLVSYSSARALYTEKKLEDFSNNWEWYFRTYTYALLAPDKNIEDLNAALGDLVAHKYANLTSEQVKGFRLEAQELGDIQLGLTGNDTGIRLPLAGYYFLGGLALIIMVSACLNYTNLSVARALTRAKEIGVRKVTGASRKAVVFQFLCEAVITSLLALCMAIVLLLVIKPAFKNLWVNKYLNFELPENPSVYLVFTGFAVLTGIISGAYPAFRLSKYQPIKALKHLDSIPGKLGMRKFLSVSQFVISLFFITTSLLIFKQFKYYQEFDYGFSSKDIVNIELQGIDHQKLAHALSSVPGVSSISASDIVPATGRNNGMELKRPGDKEEYTRTGILLTDENFIDNLELRMIAGKNLPVADSSSNRFIVVNEEAVKALGYQHPGEIIGEVFESKWGHESLEVIGVVEDFRHKLLVNSHAVGPLVLRNKPDFEYLNVKIASPDVMGTVSRMEKKWKSLDPVHPFKYEFFDDQLAATHQAIFDVVSILGFLAFLAVVIACLGMLGMATYTAERKKKEVGIRKVLGAEDLGIAFLLSRDFLKVLAFAICIGAPFSYFVNNLWLQQLPNRVEFGFATVFLATVTLMVLGLITVASQTITASRTNPVESLKTE